MPGPVGVIRSSFEGYLSSHTNNYFKKGNEWAGIFDDGAFKLVQHSASLGQQISLLQGNKEAAEKCANAADGFGSARDAIGSVRFVPALHKLFTGQTFWVTDDHGWRRVACDANGDPIPVKREDILSGVWIKQANGVWRSQTGQTSADGKYVDGNGYLRRNWMDIVMDILILFARIITPFRFLHNLKTIDLGKYAKLMGNIVMGIWGAVLSLGFIASIVDLINEVDRDLIKKRVWEAFQGFIDLVSLPFDFGVGAANPVVAGIGAGLCMLSAASLLVKEGVLS